LCTRLCSWFRIAARRPTTVLPRRATKVSISAIFWNGWYFQPSNCFWLRCSGGIQYGSSRYKSQGKLKKSLRSRPVLTGDTTTSAMCLVRRSAETGKTGNLGGHRAEGQLSQLGNPKRHD